MFRSILSVAVNKLTDGDYVTPTILPLMNCINGGSQQNWYFTPVGGGYYTLQNGLSGKCLDVTNASTQDGALMQQYSCNGGQQQNWYFTVVGNGYYTIQNQLSGKCLDDTNASTSNGTQMQQWSCNGASQQSWYLFTVNGTGGYPPDPPPPTPSNYAFTSSSSGIVYSPRSNNTVYFVCYDGYGNPVQGCDISLSTGWYPQTNAHIHTSGGQAFSNLSPSSGYTDANGNFAFTVTPGYIGQVELVLGQSTVDLQSEGFAFFSGLQ